MGMRRERRIAQLKFMAQLIETIECLLFISTALIVLSSTILCRIFKCTCMCICLKVLFKVFSYTICFLDVPESTAPLSPLHW